MPDRNTPLRDDALLYQVVILALCSFDHVRNDKSIKARMAHPRFDPRIEGLPRFHHLAPPPLRKCTIVQREGLAHLCN